MAHNTTNTTNTTAKNGKSATTSATAQAKVRDTTARMKAEYLPLNKAVKCINVSLEHEGKCVWNADLRAELDWSGFGKFSLKCCTFMGEGTDELVIGMSDYNPSADDGFTPWTGLRTRKAHIIDGKPCYRVGDLIASFQVRYMGAIRTGKRNAQKADSTIALPTEERITKAYERMTKHISEREAEALAAHNPWGYMTDADKQARIARLKRIQEAAASIDVTGKPQRTSRKKRA